MLSCFVLLRLCTAAGKLPQLSSVLHIGTSLVLNAILYMKKEVLKSCNSKCFLYLLDLDGICISWVSSTDTIKH